MAARVPNSEQIAARAPLRRIARMTSGPSRPLGWSIPSRQEGVVSRQLWGGRVRDGDTERVGGQGLGRAWLVEHVDLLDAEAGGLDQVEDRSRQMTASDETLVER